MTPCVTCLLPNFPIPRDRCHIHVYTVPQALSKLSYRRETARQLRMSIYVGWLIVQCTEHVRRIADAQLD